MGDGERPYINWILRDFHDYLVDKRNNPDPNPKKHYNGKWEFSSKWN